MEMVAAAVDSFIDVKVKGPEKLSWDFLYFMPFRDTIVHNANTTTLCVT